jgi:hypothetical protein
MALGFAALAAMSLGYLLWSPRSPDLAAQLARADVVRQAGDISWWTGWFGGLRTHDYSWLVPTWIAGVGAPVLGAAGAFCGGAAAYRLLASAQRRFLSGSAFVMICLADVVVGRLTFAVGVAVGLCSLVVLRQNRAVVSAGLAAVAFLASPLAGLFVGIAMLAVAVTDHGLRRAAVLGAGTMLLIAAGQVVFVPGAGEMPFAAADAVRGLLCCAAVAIACRGHRTISVGAMITAAAVLLFLLAPGAVGANIVRLPWMCCVPLILGYGHLPRRWMVAVLAALCAAWPISDVAGQLVSGAAPSAQRAFYQPLEHTLTTLRAAAGSAAIGQRLELVDTANHFGTTYLAPLGLARGWDRQADVADNGLFYRPGALTATSYHAWLHDLAVAWVAVPHARLDQAARAESLLIGSGLPYLRPVWSNANWQLYRVVDAAPLASGATVLNVSASAVTLRVPHAGRVLLRVRYTRGLIAADVATGQPAGCIDNEGGWTRLQLSRATTVTVRLAGAITWPRPDNDCP